MNILNMWSMYYKYVVNKRRDKIVEKWKMKDAIVGKFLWIILLTVGFMKLFIKACNDALEYYFLEVLGSMRSRSININVIIILGIISFFLSAFIVKIIMNIRQKRLGEEWKVVFEFSEEKKFKWHIAYSYVIGYWALGMLCFSIFWIMNLLEDTLLKEIPFIVCGLIRIFFMIILPYILVFCLFKPCHKYIMRKTKTNFGLIQAIGYGDGKKFVPEKYRDSSSLSAIVEILQNGEAHSISGAIFALNFKKCMMKVIKASAVVGLVIVAIGAVITMEGGARIDRESKRERASMRQDAERDRLAKSIARELKK